MFKPFKRCLVKYARTKEIYKVYYKLVLNILNSIGYYNNNTGITYTYICFLTS